MYATIDADDTTGTVHGVGDTAIASHLDALEWKWTHPELSPSLLTVPCTAAAMAFILRHGGAPSDELTVTGHLVSLRSEEE